MGQNETGIWHRIDLNSTLSIGNASPLEAWMNFGEFWQNSGGKCFFKILLRCKQIPVIIITIYIRFN